VLESQENSLLECGLSNYLAKHIMFLLHILLLDGGDPFDKGSTFESKRPTPADTAHEIFLGCPMRIEITPPIEEVSELELCLAST